MGLSEEHETWIRQEAIPSGIPIATELLAGLMDELASLRRERDALAERVAGLTKGLRAVESLMNESRGVDGLHLNGDVATWDELRTGGRFEEWLLEFDAALAALTHAEPGEACPKCRGAGYLLADTPGVKYLQLTCDACHGSGRSGGGS